MVPVTLMEHLDKLVLLVDGEIVRLVRCEPADPAHRLAQFLAGFVELHELGWP